MNKFYIDFLSNEIHYLVTVRYMLLSVFTIIMGLFITSSIENRIIILIFFICFLISLCYIYYKGERIQKVVNHANKLRKKEFLGSIKSEEIAELIEEIKNLDL